MNTTLCCDAYGVVALPPDVAATTEGGAGPFDALIPIIGKYLIEHARDIVEGFEEGWNEYQP